MSSTRSLGRRPTALVRSIRELTITEFFSAAALIGYLSSQGGMADKRMACRWASTMGTLMARETAALPPEPSRARRRPREGARRRKQR